MNGKRTRGRSGRNKPSNPRNHTYDSSGPEGKVRGTANQVLEKYLALARDAQSSGDRIGAENFFQHAEHYYRILNGFGQNDRARSQNNGGTQTSQINGHVSDHHAADRSAAGESEADVNGEEKAGNGDASDSTAPETAQT